MENMICIDDAKHVRILMDRKRLEVLRVLREHNQPMTAKQIADALGMKPATVSFHTAKLCSIGVLHVVRTEIVNGIVAKFLEPTAHHFKICATDQETGSLISRQMSDSAEVLHDRAKETFLNRINTNSMASKRLSLSDVYLSKEEFQQINDYLDGFIRDKTDRTGEDKKHYKLFFSFIACDDPNTENEPCC